MPTCFCMRWDCFIGTRGQRVPTSLHFASPDFMSIEKDSDELWICLVLKCIACPYPDLAVKNKRFVIMTEVLLVRDVGVQVFRIG